jgi:hypothetical protein
VGFKQKAGYDCLVHVFRCKPGKPGLRMVADICMGPAVESTLLHIGQIVRWQRKIRSALAILPATAQRSPAPVV